MGRLTIPDVRVDEHTTRRSVIDVAAVREHAMEFYCRLKAYEDMVDLETLNNTPISRLVELAEADKDGRCVVLPCKVGDTVYTNNRVLGADNAMHDEICTRRIKGYGGNALNKVWLIANGDYCDLSIFPSEFGKTVFLTREGAEKALEAMKDG